MSWITYSPAHRHAVGCLTLVATLLSGDGRLSPRTDAADYDGRRFVETTAKGSVGMDATVWDARSGAVVRRIDGHRENVVDVELAPNGRDVLTSSYMPPDEIGIPSKDNSIRLWDLSTGERRLYIRDATHGRFSHDGRRILGLVQRANTQTREQSFDVAAWDVRTGRRLFTVAAPGRGAGPYSDLTLQESSGSPRLLFFQSSEALVCDSRTGERVGGPFSLSEGSGRFGFISPKGDEIQLAGEGHVAYLSVASGTELKRVPLPHAVFSKIGWRPDGKGFARVGFTGEVMAYDRAMDRVALAAERLPNPESILMSPDGGRFVVNWWAGTGQPLRAKCFDAKTCVPLWEKQGRVVGFSKNEGAILRDGARLSIVDASKGHIVREVELKGVAGSRL